MTKRIKPSILTIEANASCQLRCPTCPTTSKGYPPMVGSGYLKFVDFKNLIDRNPQIKEVSFDNRGEMFLNKDLLQIIEYGAQKSIKMFANGGVNLNHVDDGVLEGLVKYRFRSLLCSIDGASPETYRIYRVRGDFHRVMEHIRQINELKLHYRSPYPVLGWQFVVFGHNEHEIRLAKEMAKKLNMQFSPKMSWDSKYSPIRDKEFVMAETGWPVVTREEFEETMGKNYMRDVCLPLWNSPRVNWDGKIMGCCWNSWGDFGGNAFHDGLVSAINNEKITLAREMLLGKRGPIDGIPCTTCDMYMKIKESRRFFTALEVNCHSLRRFVSTFQANRDSRWYGVARFLYHNFFAWKS